MSNTSGTGMSARPATPTESAKMTQAHRPATTPTGRPTARGRGGQGRGLPGHHGDHLRPQQAEGLEHREIAAAPSHPGDQHVGQGAHREQGQEGAEDERGVADPRVIPDVARPLVSGHHTRSRGQPAAVTAATSRFAAACRSLPGR